MADRYENCTEKCSQAEMAHQAALGRMYATKEFTALLKKVDSGALAEVVRCKDCRFKNEPGQPNILCYNMKDDDFCSYGERKEQQ